MPPQKFYKGQLVKNVNSRIYEIIEVDYPAVKVATLTESSEPADSFFYRAEELFHLTITPAQMKAKIEKAGRAVRFGFTYSDWEYKEKEFGLSDFGIQDFGDANYYETTDSLSISLSEEESNKETALQSDKQEPEGQMLVYESNKESNQPIEREVDLGKIQPGDTVWVELKVAKVKLNSFTFKQYAQGLIPLGQIKAHFPAEPVKTELESAEGELNNIIGNLRNDIIENELHSTGDLFKYLDRYYAARKRVEELTSK